VLSTLIPAERCARTSERDDLLLKVHDGRLGGDRATNDIAGVCEVEDNDLLRPVDLFPDTDEPIRFEGESREADGAWLNPERRELQEGDTMSVYACSPLEAAGRVL
jgi:hypothetical protein